MSFPADWLVEQVRITGFFLGDSTPSDSPRWWEGVRGNPAETRVEKRLPPVVEESGPFEAPGISGARLVLTIGPSRVDWRLLAATTESSMIDRLGRLPDAVSAITQLGRDWFRQPGVPEIKRLAFGVICHHPESDPASVNRRLQQFLPEIPIDVEHSGDFLYQINRRRPSESGIDDLQINRLSKWSAAAMQVMGLSTSGSVEPLLLLLSARLELDINTVADDSRPLGTDRLPALLEELGSLGLEIAERGDVS